MRLLLLLWIAACACKNAELEAQVETHRRIVEIADQAKAIAAVMKEGDLYALPLLGDACHDKLPAGSDGIVYYVESPSWDAAGHVTNARAVVRGFHKGFLETYNVVGEVGLSPRSAPTVSVLAVALPRRVTPPRVVQRDKLGSKFTGGGATVQVRVVDPASKATLCEGRYEVQLHYVSGGVLGGESALDSSFREELERDGVDILCTAGRHTCSGTRTATSMGRAVRSPSHDRVPGELPVDRAKAILDPPMCTETRDCVTKCDAGDASGCYWLGVQYAANWAPDTDEARTRQVPFDLSRALELFLRACDGGVAYGCRAAGNALRFGQGATEDKPRGLRLVQKACALGLDAACVDLPDDLRKSTPPK